MLVLTVVGSCDMLWEGRCDEAVMSERTKDYLYPSPHLRMSFTSGQVRVQVAPPTFGPGPIPTAWSVPLTIPLADRNGSSVVYLTAARFRDLVIPSIDAPAYWFQQVLMDTAPDGTLPTMTDIYYDVPLVAASVMTLKPRFVQLALFERNDVSTPACLIDITIPIPSQYQEVTFTGPIGDYTEIRTHNLVIVSEYVLPPLVTYEQNVGISFDFAIPA